MARWSRRKAAARARQRPALASERETSASRREPAPEAAPKTDADLPAIESLDERSDYAVFLSPKVSEHLRRMALRKLFHLPQFNVHDGLDDYAEDYTKFAALGNVMTADLRHQMERQAHALKERVQKTGRGEPGKKDEPSAIAHSRTATEDGAFAKRPEDAERETARPAATETATRVERADQSNERSPSDSPGNVEPA